MGCGAVSKRQTFHNENRSVESVEPRPPTCLQSKVKFTKGATYFGEEENYEGSQPAVSVEQE